MATTTTKLGLHKPAQTDHPNSSAADLATDMQTIDDALDTDSTMAANSDAKWASQKAVKTALALKAALASPALTGNPTAPTQTAADNSTKIATTAYADAKVADAINDGTTGIAPSQNAVFDALALKAPIESTIFLPSPRFGGILGSPALTGTHAVGWLLDASAVERLGCGFVFPSGWATYHVDFLWYNAGAGAGDVVWRHFRYQMEVGDNISSNGTDGSVQATGTAGAQNIVVQTRLATGQAVPAAGVIKTLIVDRFATDSGDTLANDAGFIGMLLTKAS